MGEIRSSTPMVEGHILTFLIAISAIKFDLPVLFGGVQRILASGKLTQERPDTARRIKSCHGCSLYVRLSEERHGAAGVRFARQWGWGWAGFEDGEDGEDGEEGLYEKTCCSNTYS